MSTADGRSPLDPLATADLLGRIIERPLLRRSVRGDLPSIEALLAASGLPLEGVAAAFENGVVAVDPALVGCAAIEPHENAALLRSVAVSPGRRGEGIGRALVREAEGLAVERGIDVLYLLTESAEAWFSSAGYRPVERSMIPPEVRASVEFQVACPTTAVAMEQRLRTSG